MIKCPNCTAQITYKVTDKVVKCDYCGGTFSPEELNATYNVADENVTKESVSVSEEIDATSYNCDNCGATLLVYDDTAVTFCNYCGSSNMIKSKLIKQTKPDFIIPFEIDKEKCIELYKKKIKYNLQNQEVKDIKTIEMINQCLNYKLSRHSKVIRKQRIMGQVAEIDGCIHEWIPEIGKCNILAIVDAGTGVLLSASLDWQETNKAYIEAINKLVNKYGLPKAIYGDRRRSIFSDGINSTKITRPLNELGVVVKCESFPEHKPNVESMWKVLQQSLPILLHQRKIKTYEQFESFVNNELCDWYNKRFRKFISPLNQFVHIEPEIFKNNFVVSETRKIRKGNYLKVDDRYLAPFNSENKRVAMREKGSINVYWNLTSENKPYVKWGSEKCYLKDIDPLVESFNPKELDPWTPLLDEMKKLLWI